MILPCLNVYVVIQKPGLRAAFESAKPVTENELPTGVMACEPVFDHEVRSWVNDTGIMQFTCKYTSASSGSDWKCLYEAASKIVERIYEKTGRSLFGATFVLPVVGDAAAGDARAFITAELDISGPIMTDSHAGVTVELYQKSDFRDSYGKSVVLAHSPNKLSDDDTHLWLAGIDSYIMQPEILAHKVSWISRPVLAEPTHNQLKVEMTSILDLVRQAADLLKLSGSGDVILQSSEAYLRNANLLSVLVTTISDLLPQVEHLKYFARNSPLKKICEGYLENAENILGQVQSLHSELLHSSQSFSRILNSAKLYIDFINAGAVRERELRNRRAERWVASVGVGIGSAEIVSDEFAKGLASLNGQDAWWAVFLIRSLIVFGLSSGMYLLWGYVIPHKKVQ